MSEIADILDRAADLIEPEGAWCQNAFTVDDGGNAVGYGSITPETRVVSCCANGALHLASGGREGAFLRAQYFLLSDISLPSVMDWNDAPERTQAEVVAKLREAAAKARAQS